MRVTWAIRFGQNGFSQLLPLHLAQLAPRPSPPHLVRAAPVLAGGSVAPPVAPGRSTSPRPFQHRSPRRCRHPVAAPMALTHLRSEATLALVPTKMFWFQQQRALVAASRRRPHEVAARPSPRSCITGAHRHWFQHALSGSSKHARWLQTCSISPTSTHLRFVAAAGSSICTLWFQQKRELVAASRSPLRCFFDCRRRWFQHLHSLTRELVATSRRLTHLRLSTAQLSYRRFQHLRSVVAASPRLDRAAFVASCVVGSSIDVSVC